MSRPALLTRGTRRASRLPVPDAVPPRGAPESLPAWAGRQRALAGPLGRSPVAKRAVDLAGSAAALAVGTLPLTAGAAAVRLRMGRPVLFRQTRPGLHGQPFTMVKLRTMVPAAGVDTASANHHPEGQGSPPGGDHAASDEARLTPLGRLLRAASIDELPELLLVLTGKMSLVGPRPLLTEYLPLYSPEQARRHEVRPGITGLAQVCGRNELSWAERLALDVWYVDHWTVALDLQILARTVLQVLARRGISAPDHATMAPFTGTPEAATS